MAANSLPEPSGKMLTVEANGLRFGLLTAAVMCVYMVIAIFAGFFQSVAAGSLDLVFLLIGVVLAVRRLRRARGEHLSYLGGLGTGIITALIASFSISCCFLVVLSLFPKQVDSTQFLTVAGVEMSGLIAFFTFVLLGTMVGVITSLIAMQFYKADPMDPLDYAERAAKR